MTLNYQTKQFKPALFLEMLKNSRRLTQMIWRENKSRVIFLIIVFLIVSAAPFLRSGSRGFLINELAAIAGGQPVGIILALATAALILAGLLPNILFAVQGYLIKMFWFLLEKKFELLLIQKKGEIDVALYEDPKHNDLFNKVSEQGIWRAQNFVDRQFYIFQNVIELVIATVILIIFKWWIFVLLLAGLIPELIMELRYGREIWSIHTSRAEMRRRFWNVKKHFDWLPSLVELKIFQNIPHFLSIIKELFQNFQKEQKIAEKKRLKFQLITVFSSELVTAIGVVWFILEVVKGDMMLGTLTFVLASIGDLRQALSGLFLNLGRHYQDNLFITDMFKLLDTKPAVKKPEAGVKLPSAETPEIIFENVTFAYPGTVKPVLKNFSLKIAAGDKVALVGLNGAGKTTFVKLLCRFYDPDKGKILVAGRNLKELDLESWYSQLGVLFQDYAHYHFLVKEAIAVGRTATGSSLEKVKEAAQASEADVFIEEWEKNYEQMLGREFTGGIEPSIGQWQKLALARTFYRNPRILILDEPTASIDAQAEANIFKKLKLLPKDRTVILISHRFSTVRQADRIIVIDKGKIKELGRHSDLLKLNGLYAKLFKLQAKGYR